MATTLPTVIGLQSNFARDFGVYMAKLGILIKDLEAIENRNSVQDYELDKARVALEHAHNTFDFFVYGKEGLKS